MAVIEGNVYVDDGATSVDTFDGATSGNIVTVNPVDVNVPDTYIVTYDVSDATGNPAVTEALWRFYRAALPL